MNKPASISEPAGAQTLSRTETHLLDYLKANAGRPVSRAELLRNVWRLNPQGISTRTVDVHVAKLRCKIESDRQHPSRLLTVFRCGYMLASDATS